MSYAYVSYYVSLNLSKMYLLVKLRDNQIITNNLNPHFYLCIFMGFSCILRYKVIVSLLTIEFIDLCVCTIVYIKFK